MHEPTESLRGRLIVSVQVYPGEPVCHPETIARIACAAQIGGATVIRCQGLASISMIERCVEVPVVGLWREGHKGVYIIPSLRHARACTVAGYDIVTIGMTPHPRLDGRTFAEAYQILHGGSALVIAGCGSFEGARTVYEAGADIVSTTLVRYTGGRKKSVGPDLELLKGIVTVYPDATVACEDRIHMFQDAVEATNVGAFAVTVSAGITYPTSITTWFKDTIGKC